MSLLPWLLDWPPSRGAIAVFLVATAFSVGSIAVLGGGPVQPGDDTVSVEAVDVTVTLNDEVELPPGVDEPAQTCVASGTPGDSVFVQGSVVVFVPEDRWSFGDERRLNVSVSLGHADAATIGIVTGPGFVTREVFWLLDDDESLAVDGTETVQVRVLEDGSTVANATQAVTVQEGTRHYEC